MNSASDDHGKYLFLSSDKDSQIINFNDQEAQTSEIISKNKKSSVIDILRQKEGVRVDPDSVSSIALKHPDEILKDFPRQTISQNETETNKANEEEEGEEGKSGGNSSDTSFYDEEFYNASDLSRYQQHGPCVVCKKQIEGNLESVFDCTDKFCHDCILKRFGKKIQGGEDIETFVCPQDDCKQNILVDRFARFVPEVDHRDIGDIEIGICSICFETMKGNEDLLKIFECKSHLFCYDCTLSYLKESINNRKALNLKCPDFNCESLIDDSKTKNLIPSYLFNRYMRYKRNALIEKDPDLRWCTRPGCEGVVKRMGSLLQAHCECGQLTCIGCGNQWHNNKTCEEVLEEEHKLFIKQKDIQFCPECKSKVEKSSGCNHMTCPICTYQWCWLCGRECPSNHFDIFNPLGCPGLMLVNNSKKKWATWKLIAYKLRDILLLVLSLPLGAVALIIIAILVPALIYKHCFDCFNGYADCLIKIFLVLLGVIILPLTIVVGVVGAIVPGTCYLAMYFTERHNNHANAKNHRLNLIPRRLGEAPLTENFKDLEANQKTEDINRRRLILTQPLLGDVSGGIYIP